MRFSRLACGIIAAAVGVVAGVIVQALETRFLGAPTRASFWVSFFGAGGAVLWLVDRLGLLASPYVEPTLGLGRPDATDRNVEANEQPPWRRHFDLGMAAGGAGDVPGALPHFSEAVRIAPLEPYPHYELAYTLSLLGQWDRALVEFRRTNELVEGFFLVQTEVYICEAVLSGLLDNECVAVVRQIQRLGDSGRMTGPEAVSLSQELIERAPACALGYYYLGKALFTDDPKRSEVALQHCLTLAHDDTTAIDALTHIGSHKRAAGDVESARAIWSEVVAKYKNNPHVKPTEVFLLHADMA